MPTGDSSELFGALAEFGYSLLQPKRFREPNDLLARMSASSDARVLEGFPVVLGNALRQTEAAVSLEEAEKSFESEKDKNRFRALVHLSFVLFDWYGAAKGEKRPSWLEESKLRSYRDCFAHDQPLEVSEDLRLDSGRLRNTFVSYFLRNEVEKKRREEEKASFEEELRLAYFLSLLLTPRQKQLVKKRMRGEELTKTEREYYSRVVKKKLKAMADPDLHRFAQKALLESHP
ncbi:MAG: hypothetical protein CO113_09290 [Elusimicrobia bacterium CG_4_9_14_3_um_filter_62_55]|nr:MAG: hypothetical protein COR54_16895 [Elusimicrobia bacterium CG22_combo_CG10-13_8_21_14_all_63_91]PJA16699.1 MAG: hypothetical protein COX66_06945 [Elusimicrobia bacterium CG_4_10_14_0_2_um_filter_63_34]PJB25331.1 MAG: hypothetical protein CO113_09290 [Elusimicrobia bacterium CG_4_9_14_3_um_filter_62_55]